MFQSLSGLDYRCDVFTDSLVEPLDLCFNPVLGWITAVTGGSNLPTYYLTPSLQFNPAVRYVDHPCTLDLNRSTKMYFRHSLDCGSAPSV